VCGIPRHESEWVSIIKNNSNKINLPFKNYETVVIFSSPYTESNSYLPINKKQEIIKDIKKTVIDILGMKVVIKIHPKEGLEGVYEEVFGLDQYGSTWVYSDLHQFALAADKKLAITMWSGVCFDMIKIGVPCIEYVDLRTVKGFNDYDKNGEKVSPFVYFGLAIGVRNHNEFLCQVKKILKMADGGSAVPIDNYERYIVSNNDASSKIALDILSKTA